MLVFIFGAGFACGMLVLLLAVFFMIGADDRMKDEQ